MSGFIYKITNNINGKVYIGKTTETIKERFQGHINDSKRERCKNRPLYRAFNKYGIENFSIELVEEVPLESLSDREIYWIGYYHSYEEGYNATIGGDSKILYDHDKILERIKDGRTTKEIMEEFGCCRDIVYNIAKSAGVKIFYEESQLVKDMKNSSKRIRQLDLSSNYLRSFDSSAEAGKWLVENGYAKSYTGGVRSHILDVCKGIRKTAYKFKWEFE